MRSLILRITRVAKRILKHFFSLLRSHKSSIFFSFSVSTKIWTRRKFQKTFARGPKWNQMSVKSRYFRRPAFRIHVSVFNEIVLLLQSGRSSKKIGLGHISLYWALVDNICIRWCFVAICLAEINFVTSRLVVHLLAPHRAEMFRTVCTGAKQKALFAIFYSSKFLV